MKLANRLCAGVLLPAVLACGAAPALLAGQEYRIGARTEGPLLGAGAMLLGGGLLAWPARPAGGPADFRFLDPAGLPAWDRGSVGRWSPRAAAWSDGILCASLAAPLALAATDGGRDQAGRLTVMYAETLLISTGLTGLLKALIARPRPYAYGENPAVPEELLLEGAARRSFPSGHTATVFACLTFGAVVHRDLYPEAGGNDLILAGAFGVGALTGYLRCASGRHFPSDVAAGAVLGAAVGWLVPGLHRQQEAGDRSGPAVLPLFTVAGRF